MLHIPGEQHVLVKMGPFWSQCSSSEVLTLKHLSLDCAPVKTISLGHQCHWSPCVPLENGPRLTVGSATQNYFNDWSATAHWALL